MYLFLAMPSDFKDETLNLLGEIVDRPGQLVSFHIMNESDNAFLATSL